VKTGGAVPPYAYIVIGCLLLFGLWRLVQSIENFRATWRTSDEVIPVATLQMIVWAVLISTSIAAYAFHHELIALVALVIAVMLPATKRKKALKAMEGWEEKPAPAKQADRS
jgi:hypothetical protein